MNVCIVKLVFINIFAGTNGTLTDGALTDDALMDGALT